LYKFKSKSKRIRDGCNFDISKCYADGKDLLLTGSYIDPEFFLCPTVKKEQYKIKTASQDEIDSCKNKALKAIHIKMKSLVENAKESFIVPLLLTIPPEDHLRCLTSKYQ
jgi:hypothetical protein